jgi:hypothetical protein
MDTHDPHLNQFQATDTLRRDQDLFVRQRAGQSFVARKESVLCSDESLHADTATRPCGTARRRR